MEQAPNVLNLENKFRQQSKIAHEQGAGSECLKCGPKCSGFDLHFWRKICRNCRCGKENHSVNDDEDIDHPVFSGGVLGSSCIGAGRNYNMNRDADCKRALDRQLPVYDLDPNQCQPLSEKEKQRMDDYVRNVKDLAIGRGLMQQCPPSPCVIGPLPAPPAHLDRILEQKLNQLNIKPSSVHKATKQQPPEAKHLTPKPYKPIRATHTRETSPIPSIPIQSIPSQNECDNLPPPPPEFLLPLNEPVIALDNIAECPTNYRRSRDPVDAFLDFLDEQQGKKLPGKLQSPFLLPNASPPIHLNPGSSGRGSPIWRPVANSSSSSPNLSSKQKQFRSSPTNQVETIGISAQAAAPDLKLQKILLPAGVNDLNANSDEQQLLIDSEQQHSESSWYCQKCAKPISAGQVGIFAERAGGDKCWHPDCFSCNICNEVLADLIYFYVDNNIFCGRHYAEKINVPRCKACDELIFAPEYTSAEGANWHTNHFCCFLCDTPLAGHQYTPIEGQPHCLGCYQKKYGKDCRECGKPIRADEARVSHGDMHWHASAPCFRCAGCHISMINKQFLLKNDMIYCSRSCVTQKAK